MAGMTRHYSRSIAVRLPGMTKADQDIYLELLEAVEHAVRTVLPKGVEWVLESDGRVTVEELNEANPAREGQEPWESRDRR